MSDDYPFEPNPYSAHPTRQAPVMRGPEPLRGLSGFDKFCAVLAFALGIVLLVLGAIGIFAGCRAHFSLPPVFGGIPLLVGWGILRPVYKAWKIR